MASEADEGSMMPGRISADVVRKCGRPGLYPLADGELQVYEADIRAVQDPSIRLLMVECLQEVETKRKIWYVVGFVP